MSGIYMAIPLGQFKQTNAYRLPSGCAHCVYDVYQESLEDYRFSLSAARKTLLRKYQEHPFDWPAILGTRVAASGDSNAKQIAKEEVELEIEDPTLRAFLLLERKLREKRQAAGNQTQP